MSDLIQNVMVAIGVGVTAAVYFLTSHQDKVARKRLEASFSGTKTNATVNSVAQKNKRNYFSNFDGFEEKLDRFFENVIFQNILWIGIPVGISYIIRENIQDKSYFPFICGGMVFFSVLIYLMSKKMFWLILLFLAIAVSVICAIFFLIGFALVPGVCCLLLAWIFGSILVAMAGD